MKRRSVEVIRVFPSPLDRRRGRLAAGSLCLPCALGRSGTTRAKREGDGATPLGRLAIIGLAYRSDRTPRPRTAIRTTSIRPDDGWCDDPASRLYNRPVRLPFGFGHERMWRDDALYDVVVDLAWNRRPAIRGRGSAIFLHAARPDLSPTQGCIAVPRGRIRLLAERIGRRTVVAVADRSRARRRPDPHRS